MPFSLKFKSKFFECEQEGEALKINLKNDWNYKLPAKIWKATQNLLSSNKFSKIVLNFKDVKEFDYAAALFLKNTLQNARKSYELINLTPHAQKIFVWRDHGGRAVFDYFYAARHINDNKSD